MNAASLKGAWSAWFEVSIADQSTTFDYQVADRMLVKLRRAGFKARRDLRIVYIDWKPTLWDRIKAWMAS